LRLANRDHAYEGVALKFFEHFAAIAEAIDELWDDDDGFFYDRIEMRDGELVPIKVRSMVGVLPVLASVLVDEVLIDRAETVGKAFATMLGRRGFDMSAFAEKGLVHGEPGNRQLLLGVVGIDRVKRIFDRLFAEDEFLSPYGLRAVSQAHRDHPYDLVIGEFHASIDYEPAESTTNMFGGNSNWRGPVWLPVNYLAIRQFANFQRFFGDDFKLEYPTSSGEQRTFGEIGQDLADRIIAIWLPGPDGRRPVYGGTERFQTDPAWKDNLTFNEYFHGDNGAGLGATHQTGWTALVADLILDPPGS
jgi:hypothetical protein